jgi:hypothetical protein
MPLFYLHLRDGTDEILDPDGVQYANNEALKKAVLAGVRDIMAGDIKTGGVLDLRYRIDAENAEGKIVYSLPFAHAVNIIPAE